MKKFGIQVTLLIIFIFSALYISYHPLGNLQPLFSVTNNLPAKKVEVGSTLVNVEVADTPASRSQGLSGRQSLDVNAGMLFVFDSPQKYQFWMKKMKFPLDFIFIENGKVVDIIKNVANPALGTKDSDLPIYEPITSIDMMLEVNAGFVDSRNIHIGDSVNLNS